MCRRWRCSGPKHGVGSDSRFRFVRHDVSEGPLDPPLLYDPIVASEVPYFFEEPAV